MKNNMQTTFYLACELYVLASCNLINVVILHLHDTVGFQNQLNTAPTHAETNIDFFKASSERNSSKFNRLQ